MDKKRGAWLLTLAVTCQAGLAGFAGFGLLAARPAGTLPPDAFLGSMPLGGMTITAAQAAVLSDPAAAGVPGKVRVTLDGDVFPIGADAVGLSIDPDALQRMLTTRQTGSEWDRLLAGFSVAPQTDAAQAGVPLAIDSDLLAAETAAIDAAFRRESVQAHPRMEGSTLVVDPETVGRSLDVQAFTQWLTVALGQGRVASGGTLALDPSADGVAVYVTQTPDILSDTYAGMRQAGTAQVRMVEGFDQDARQTAERLDGLLLAPGDTLDFNRQISSVADSLGSIDSPSRAASAVFSAMLAVRGVTVVERHPAPYAANYAAPGQEAMAGDGIGNLVLRNDTGLPLLLMAEASQGMLQTAVFMVLTEAPATLFSDVTETTEPPLILSPTRELAPDEVRIVAQGRAGMDVDVYRVDGSGKTLLHTDHYPPQNRVLEVGMSQDPRVIHK